MYTDIWSEEEIEGFLVEETRSLTFPDGTSREVTCPKVIWENLDIVVSYGTLSPEEIAGIALFRASRMNYELGRALTDVLRPLRKEANQKLDEKIAALKLRLRLMSKPS